MIERAVIAHQLPTTFSSMMFPQSSRRLFALALYEVLSGSFDHAKSEGAVTRITRWAAGTVSPEPSVHEWCEEVFIVSGTLSIGTLLWLYSLRTLPSQGRSDPSIVDRIWSILPWFYSWHLYLSYGLVCGLGQSLAFFSPIVMMTRWFSTKLARAHAVANLGGALTPLVLGPVLPRAIAAIGWRNVLLCLAGADALLLGSAALLLTPPRDHKATTEAATVTVDEGGAQAVACKGHRAACSRGPAEW